jgi:hypothetical protein
MFNVGISKLYECDIIGNQSLTGVFLKRVISSIVLSFLIASFVSATPPRILSNPEYIEITTMIEKYGLQNTIKSVVKMSQKDFANGGLKLDPFLTVMGLREQQDGFYESVMIDVEASMSNTNEQMKTRGLKPFETKDEYLRVFIKMYTPLVHNMRCSMPGVRAGIDAGATYTSVYQEPSGVYLATIVVDESVCKESKVDNP